VLIWICRRLNLVCVVVAACLVGSGVSSEEVSSDVRALLKRTGEFYGNLGGFHVEVASELRRYYDDKKESKAIVIDMTVKRPELASIRLKDPKTTDLMGWVVADNECLYEYFAERSGYYVSRRESDIQHALHLAAQMGSEPALCASALLDEVLHNRPFSIRLMQMSRGDDLGVETVNGTSCRHIRCVFPTLSVFVSPIVDLWIAEGDKPLIVRALLDLTEADRQFSAKTFTIGPDGQKKPKIPAKQVYSELEFRNWTTDVQSESDAFKFVPPDGAKPLPPLRE